LLAADGGYAFDLGVSRDWARENAALGGSAVAFLTTAIRCLLVGLGPTAQELLLRCVDWCTEAIDSGERPANYAAHGTEAERFRTVAFARWLRDAVHDKEALDRFVDSEDRFLAASGLWKSKEEIGLIAPWYLYAGAYQRAVELTSFTQSGPRSLSLRTEAATVHEIASRQLARDTGFVIKAFASPLMQHLVPQWLERGLQTRAALWMRIIEGSTERTPAEVVSCCLYYLEE
jgi:hypothetical protein